MEFQRSLGLMLTRDASDIKTPFMPEHQDIIFSRSRHGAHGILPRRQWTAEPGSTIKTLNKKRR
jgi:hypothetical protein